MPRRKGYGIPPTKRIKIENENDENEPSDNKSEDTHENCNPDQAPTSASENISNTLANATTNGSHKYLHKKFKKMVAILSDDCASSTEANNNQQRQSNRDDVSSIRQPCSTTPPLVPLPAMAAPTVNHHEASSVAVTQSSLPEYVPRIDAYSVTNRDQQTALLGKSTTTTTASTAATVAVILTSVQCNTFTTTTATEDDSAVPAIIGRYACPYCKLVCNKPSVLQKHIRAHTNERPYPCLPCGFAFKTRSNLYKHCRSRSHSLKMEEAGVDGTKMYEEEPEEEDDDSQTPSLKDESSNDENKTESVPRTSIYKPKFHKAAIYIQSNNAAVTSSSKIENSMNKLGLQLKIPSTSTTTAQNSTPSTPSPFTSGSSPSPEFLHRHISKLISENQAIVETTDPFWSKKFYQRKEGSPSSPLSTSSSSSLDSYKKIPIKQEPQSIEDRLPVESKLAHALLQPRVTKAVISEMIEDAQPLNLTICKDTRARSYHDELEDERTAEHIVPSHEIKFVPNGRIVPEIHPNAPVKNKFPSIEHLCSLCDETFDNYDKLKQHILYQCKGNKNHSLSKSDAMRVYLKVPETKMNPNQSPGPRLGNTPLIGNYKKLSVITPLTQDKLKTVPMDQKCITSLKSLEELSNAPMKGNQYVYNTALINDEKIPSRMEYRDVKNSVIISKIDEQKVIMKTTSVPNKAKELDTSTTKTTSNTPKISQFVIPFVQGVPNLASIQGVPAIITVTTNSGGNVHTLTPIPSAYKPAALPVNAISKSKFAHVNGEMVTIMHGGKVIPHVPGMPGPQSMGPAYVRVDGFEKKEAVKRKCEDGPMNGMMRNNQRMEEIHVPKIVHGVKIKEESVIYADQDKDSSSGAVKFARPSSLPLKPGTFVPKKLQPGTSSVLPLISPETPRPNKSYGQLYIGGNAYTYLGLKCSTRSTFCTLHKSQPTYVPLSPEHNKVSMYSNWKIRSDVDPYLRGVPPTKAMSCYDSRQRYSSYTVVHTKMKDAVTHSSYWFNRSKIDLGDLKQSPDDDKENLLNELHGRNEDGLKNSKICLGGIESTDEYTYIRGRGRGKYVCLECGIRCRKPSMLKKHIRTHTDVRPYICKHCVFSFKTKGNLTKHMKSKAHYKKCIELGIVPVPTVVDDTYVDEDILSKQAQQIEEGQDIEETEEEDDDDDDDDDDDNDDDYVEDKEAVEDPKWLLEREVARSLLSLSKMSHQTVSEQYANAGLVPLNARPNTYPYNFSANPHLSSKPHTPTLTLFSEQKEQEKVSKNTGLARELQPASTSHQLVKPKSETHTNERYYFGSTDKEIVSMETNDVPESIPKEQLIGKNSFMDRGMKMETDRGSDSDSKENLAVTPTDNEKAECSTSVIISVGSPNSNSSANSPKKLKAEFISPCSGPLTKYASVLEDGRSKCVVCNKIFSKPSQLRLHVNIHYFEQPFRCESCAVSFRTKGHLHKHLGSNSHLNKVSMNSATGGQTSTNNPRPFKCDDCNIGFRIHGHLAKHLRSKMHIMKLECLGKLPFGTYAEMERCGINMNDIDTTDCENSLESLQRIAKGVVNSVMYVSSGDEDNKMSTDSSF